MSDEPLTHKRRANIWKLLGYFGFIYVIFMLLIAVGYPLAKQYAAPVAQLIFPLDPRNTMLKNIIVSSGMYWMMVAIYVFAMRRRFWPKA